MRGLIKRDDRSCELASTHQVLLGSCLTAHASGASLSLGELPLRMHMCAMRMSLYTSTSTVLWSLIRRRGVHSLEACCTHPLICRSHAHPRPPLLASSSCFPRPQLGLLVLG